MKIEISPSVRQGLAAKLAALTSEKIKHLAGEALKDPSSVTQEQVRELAGSVLAHIHRVEAEEGKTKNP
jgi:hypothetical protein